LKLDSRPCLLPGCAAGTLPLVTTKINTLVENGKLLPTDLSEDFLRTLTAEPAPVVLEVLYTLEFTILKSAAARSSISTRALQRVRETKSAIPSEKERAVNEFLKKSPTGIIITPFYRQYGGPPANWSGPAPDPRTCQIYVGKIPTDMFEHELVPFLEKFGTLYEIKLMMIQDGVKNRGYAYVTMGTPEAAESCLHTMDKETIRERVHFEARQILPTRLYFGCVPKKLSSDQIKSEANKISEGVIDVIVYKNLDPTLQNRGFAFVEYSNAAKAERARRLLLNSPSYIQGNQITVDLADPQVEPNEEAMSSVKIVFVGNLSTQTSVQKLTDLFSLHGPLETVRHRGHFAYVHFKEREHALAAIKAMQGKTVDGYKLQVCLSRPLEADRERRRRYAIQ